MKLSRSILAFSATLLAGASPRLGAATLWKDASLDALNSTTSWWTTETGSTDVAAITTADVLRFGGVGQGSSIAGIDLGGDFSVGGIRLDNASSTVNYSVTINAGNTLTLAGSTTSADIGYTTPTGISMISGAGGDLTLNNDVVIGAAQQWVTGNTRDILVNGSLALGANNLTFAVAGGSQGVAGVISGSGAITKSGAGTLNLSNQANLNTGSVAFAGGTVTVTKLAAAGTADSFGNQAAGSRVFALNGSTLSYVGEGLSVSDRHLDLRASSIIQNNTAAGTLQLTSSSFATSLTASARVLTLSGSNTNDNLFAGAIANSGGGTAITTLQKSGLGTWIVTGNSPATGGVIINQGTLRVTGSGVLPGASGLTGDSGNLWFTSSNSGGAIEFETVAQLGAADQIRFRNTGGTSGAGGRVRYIGTDTQTLAKVLQCDTSIGMRLESDSVGGKLVVAGSFLQVNRSLWLAGTGTGLNELSIAFAGSGALTKQGSGTWLLSAANTHSGGVIIEQGTLRVNALSGLGSGALSVRNGGVFQYAGTSSESLSRGLSFDSGEAVFDIVEASGALTWTGSSGTRTGAFVKSGAGSLTLNASLTGAAGITVTDGTLTLGSANSHSGDTLLSGGTLALSGSGTLGTGAVTVTAGTLDLGGLAAANAITLSGGALANASAYAGVLTLAGNASVGGTVGGTFGTGTDNARVVTLSGGAAAFTGTLKGVGTLVGDVTVSGAHTPGNSPGVQTIDGNLTYSGGASTVQWELVTQTAATAQAGVAYDQIVVTGDLTFDGATALALVFNGDGSDVNWTDAFWASARSWLVYDVAGATTSFGNLTITGATLTDDGYLAVNSVQDSTGATLASARQDAGFYLGQVGSDVRLFYRPVPEPSTYGLILGALALAGAAVRRRKKTSK